MANVREITPEEIMVETGRLGYELMNVRNLTDHPDDWYLKVVRAYSAAKDEYVVWLYNGSLGGLHEGYYTRNKDASIDKYWSK